MILARVTRKVMLRMAKRRNAPKIPRITQLASGSYNCQIMYNGKRQSITEDTYDDCLARVMDIMAKRKASGSRSAGSSPAAKAKKLTLRQAIDIYIELRSNVLSPSTIRGYRYVQNNRFVSVMDLPLYDTIDNWQALINAESKAVSAKTVKNAWGLVRRVLSVNNLPVPSVTLPQVVKNEHDFFQPEQVKSFVKAVKGDKYELFYLLGLHGLRCSEILAIDVKKNIDKNFIRVRGSVVQGLDEDGISRYQKKDTNKTASSRRDVPVLISRITQIIHAEKRKKHDVQELIPPHPDAVRKHMKKVCMANNLPYVGLHGLRHSFASLCYHLGISELETMRLGGWSDIGVMKKIYTHLANIDKASSENKLKSFFSDTA